MRGQSVTHEAGGGVGGHRDGHVPGQLPHQTVRPGHRLRVVSQAGVQKVDETLTGGLRICLRVVPQIQLDDIVNGAPVNVGADSVSQTATPQPFGGCTPCRQGVEQSAVHVEENAVDLLRQVRRHHSKSISLLGPTGITSRKTPTSLASM